MAKKKVKSKAKQQPAKVSNVSISESITSEVIAEAYTSVPHPQPPVFMKLCRLCESKDGPFLNIFDADKVTAKKIDELMPFGIAENDDLPHKICFRCSAKLEELYEFIQKCIKTQENLRTALGKSGPLVMKTKTRTAWEQKLNKTNLSNDDICDALIKKAMEGIKDIPLNPLPVKEESPSSVKRVTRRTENPVLKKEPITDENEDMKVSLKQTKPNMQKAEPKLPLTKPTKANDEAPQLPVIPQSEKKPQIEKKSQIDKKTKIDKNPVESKEKNNSVTNNLSFDYEEEKVSSDIEEIKEVKPPEKPFNIMDHISMIKVNGVGVLFQCELCNRNFLKKEVVESHNCAKNGRVPKVEVPKTVPVPEPPKVSTVKYIKIEDMKKSISRQLHKMEKDRTPSIENNKDYSPINENKQKEEDTIPPAPIAKPKSKAGPASKTKRTAKDSDPVISQKESVPQELPSANPQSPSVHIPSVPNLNGRYKLVPGPNNVFTLVEDSAAVSNEVQAKESQKSSKKRKGEEITNSNEIKPKDRKKDKHENSSSPDLINVQEQSKPYPVGLFQTVGHASRMYEPPMTSPPPTPFTTPAMKKQSYTIVQTGNPSKLLISTKAQAAPVETPKKRTKKSKQEEKADNGKEPFNVTLEDVAPPKDSGFFTFINVDPLLQPSYVLPTDNIIQESQISTSSSVLRNSAAATKESKDNKYSCNMCGESFSREKKLLTHIQSHYTKMDEEDQLRSEKGPKKRKSK